MCWCNLLVYMCIMENVYWEKIKLFEIEIEDIELMKCLSDIFCRCVSKIRHIPSVIHYTIRGVVCFQFTHFPCDD